jgi:DNA-directed RNA polymerase subunit RPC12/RpoP
MPICPGSDMRKLKADLYPCSMCGTKVEMFSDEYRRRCPNCRTVVEKDAVPACASYCQAAKECLGEERYQEFLERTREAASNE